MSSRHFRARQPWAPSLRRFMRFLAFGATLAGPAFTASAADAPLAGSPFYFQTSGAATGLTVGDWYTNSATGGNGYHYYQINVPCPGVTAINIHVDIFSPEMHGAPGTTLDELRDAGGAATTAVAEASNTRFEIYAAGTAFGPFATPAPGGAGSILSTTYTPVTTNDAWVRFYTLPAGSACGSYLLRAETVGATSNDDNSWRLRVSGDDDANPTTTPPTTLDPGITLAQIYGSMQQNSGAVACISTYELLGAGNATFHNFDLDGNTTVTYNPARNGAASAGTLSADSSWNVGTGAGPAPRDGDLVAVAANQTGYWRIDTCLSSGNQFIQEGGTPFPGLFQLPLSMTLTKTDGVTTAQMGGYLQYTLTFTNTSVPTSGVAKSVVITDTIPTNSTFDSASVSAPFTGTCTFGAGVVTCPINENVSPGASGTVIVTVLVNDPAAGTTVVNNATLGFSDLLDAQFPLVTASDTDQLPALKLVKTSANPGDTGDGPQVGDTITYTLTLSNPSGARQTGLVVNDPLPAGTTYVANSTVATGQVAFLDQFSAIAYNGNNGRAFLTNWTEVGDDAAPGGGSIRVVADLGDNSLRLAGNAGNDTIERQMNLVGCTSASVTYQFRRDGPDAGENVIVEASANGAVYATLATILGNGGTDGAYLPSGTLAIAAAQISATTRLRFRLVGISGAAEFVYVDDIQVEANCAIDNIAGGIRPDLASGAPPTLVTAADGFVMDAGDSMTVTFQVNVTVAGPIVNTATATSTQDTDPATGTVRDVAVTRASIGGVRVSGGVVEFATTWQRGTRGFHLYSSSGRSRRDEKRRINARLIESPRPESLTPILYRVDAQVDAPWLWIEEIEVGDDSGRLMGPFAVDDTQLIRTFERLELKLSGQPREQKRDTVTLRRPVKRGFVRGEPTRIRARTATMGVKIEIAEPGTVLVPWDDLRNAGLPARLIANPGRIELTTEGQSVAFSATARGLSFIAKALATDHAARNVYVVTWQGVPKLEVPLSRSEPRVPNGVTRIQKNWIYYQSAPRDSDPWLWDLLTPNDAWPTASDPSQGDFDLVGLGSTPANVAVRIALVGRTSTHHAITAEINGVPVGQVEFDGPIVATLNGAIPGSALKATGNHVTLSYDSDDPGAYAYLNYVDFGLALSAQAGAVARIAPYDLELPENLAHADYLIVTHSDFVESAERIARIKRSRGTRAVVVDVERAFDRFSAGIPESAAVRELIRLAPRARRVLLVGDDTIDPGDNYEQGERVFVPSAQGWDEFTGRVASENLYADRNNDGAPDLAIGRLAVRDIAAASIAADKIEFGDALLAGSRGRHVVVVDNQGASDMAFRGEGRRIEAMLGVDAAVFADVSLGSAEARDDLLVGLADGAETVTWLGHGAPDHWADEVIFEAADAESLAHSNRAAILLMWACLSSDYRYFFGSSVSEAMQNTPEGGAVATFGPTGLSLPTLQRELYVRLYSKLLAGVPIGEAIRQSKAELVKAQPSAREFLNGWVLLGDPDQKLRP